MIEKIRSLTVQGTGVPDDSLPPPLRVFRDEIVSGLPAEQRALVAYLLDGSEMLFARPGTARWQGVEPTPGNPVMLGLSTLKLSHPNRRLHLPYDVSPKGTGKLFDGQKDVYAIESAANTSDTHVLEFGANAAALRHEWSNGLAWGRRLRTFGYPWARLSLPAGVNLVVETPDESGTTRIPVHEMAERFLEKRGASGRGVLAYVNRQRWRNPEGSMPAKKDLSDLSSEEIRRTAAEFVKLIEPAQLITINQTSMRVCFLLYLFIDEGCPHGPWAMDRELIQNLRRAVIAAVRGGEPATETPLTEREKADFYRRIMRTVAQTWGSLWFAGGYTKGESAADRNVGLKNGDLDFNDFNIGLVPHQGVAVFSSSEFFEGFWRDVNAIINTLESIARHLRINSNVKADALGELGNEFRAVLSRVEEALWANPAQTELHPDYLQSMLGGFRSGPSSRSVRIASPAAPFSTTLLRDMQAAARRHKTRDRLTPVIADTARPLGLMPRGFGLRYLDAMKKNQPIRARIYLTLSGLSEEGSRFVFQEGLALAALALFFLPPLLLLTCLFGFRLTDLAPPFVAVVFVLVFLVRYAVAYGYACLFAYRFHPQGVIGANNHPEDLNGARQDELFDFAWRAGRFSLLPHIIFPLWAILSPATFSPVLYLAAVGFTYLAIGIYHVTRNFQARAINRVLALANEGPAGLELGSFRKINVYEKFTQDQTLADGKTAALIVKHGQHTESLDRRWQKKHAGRNRLDDYYTPIRHHAEAGFIQPVEFDSARMKNILGAKYEGLEPRSLARGDGVIAIAFADEIVILDRSGESLIRRIKNSKLKSIHSVVFSKKNPSRLLAASTGADRILELDINTNRVTWEWNPWNHGYSRNPMGFTLIEKGDPVPEEARVLTMDQARAVVSADDHGPYAKDYTVVVDYDRVENPLGLENWLRVAQPNGADYSPDENEILSTLYKTNQAVAIDRHSGNVRVLLDHLSRPHGLSRYGGGSIFTNTMTGEVLFLDEDFKPSFSLDFSKFPTDDLKSRLPYEWLQNTTYIRDGLLASIDSKRSQIVIWDLFQELYAIFPTPPSWSVQAVLHMPTKIVSFLSEAAKSPAALKEKPKENPGSEGLIDDLRLPPEIRGILENVKSQPLPLGLAQENFVVHDKNEARMIALWLSNEARMNQWAKLVVNPEQFAAVKSFLESYPQLEGRVELILPSRKQYELIRRHRLPSQALPAAKPMKIDWSRLRRSA